MTPHAALHRYLQSHREILVWKLDGLDDRQVRWPMTPTGTNLLGLIKHMAGVEQAYFGAVFGREHPIPMPWLDEDAEPDADMWATAGLRPEALNLPDAGDGWWTDYRERLRTIAEAAGHPAPHSNGAESPAP